MSAGRHKNRDRGHLGQLRLILQLGLRKGRGCGLELQRPEGRSRGDGKQMFGAQV